MRDEGARDGAKATRERRGAGSSSEEEARETNEARAVGQEKRRGEANAAAEAWEAREKRRRKGKHGKSRRERREKARATTDESAKAREDVDMGSESTSSGGARDLDSARASPPLSDEVSEAATATADGEANIPLVGAQVVVGVAFEQGQRAYMEDRYSAVTELKPFGLTGCDGVRRSFLGVYDGHNGDWAAQFASERMHTFLAPDVLLQDSSPSCPERLTRFNVDMETS